MAWIAVGIGGALGSMARHWVNLEMAHRLERSVPHATFVVNVVGCLLIGALGGDHARALWNVVGQIALGLGGVWLGFHCAS